MQSFQGRYVHLILGFRAASAQVIIGDMEVLGSGDAVGFLYVELFNDDIKGQVGFFGGVDSHWL